jgi:hypothetical protein
MVGACSRRPNFRAGRRLGQRGRDVRFLAGQDLLAIEVAAVGNSVEFLRPQRRLGLLGHGPPERLLIGDLPLVSCCAENIAP